MKPTTRHAEQAATNRRKRADQAAGCLLSDATANCTIEPVATSEWAGGSLLTFEADDQVLLANGLVEPTDLPKSAAGCKVKRQGGTDILTTFRMRDGRVRVTLSAHLVRQRDAGFVDFMARLAWTQPGSQA